MTTLMLVLWTIVLVGDIMMAVLGDPPNWVFVFCPLIAVWFNSLMEYIHYEKKNLS